jgi:hypothetical protein
VRNVPVIAPAVPIAERRPTSVPLVPMSVSDARTIIGPTADRIVAGRTKPAPASATIPPNSPPSPRLPTASTIGTDAIAATPPAASVGPISRSGPRRSAARPPSQAPSAMPARITPMIPV